LPGVAAAGAGSVSPKGFTGGLTAGYNWQWNRLVFGLEADIDAFMLKGSRSGIATDGVGVTHFVNQEVKTDWLATLRPRIGYAFDNILIYGTGGLAVTNLKYSVSYTTDNPGLPGGADSVSKTKLGWTAGLGAEYALSQRWSLKAEYLYASFDSVSFDQTLSTTVPRLGTFSAVLTNTADLKVNIVRAGINYRF
jgi:outer membrane immunogenic protein